VVYQIAGNWNRKITGLFGALQVSRNLTMIVRLE